MKQLLVPFGNKLLTVTKENNEMNAYEDYMKSLANGMRSELTNHGFESLETSEAVGSVILIK